MMIVKVSFTCSEHDIVYNGMQLNTTESQHNLEEGFKVSMNAQCHLEILPTDIVKLDT